MLFPHFRAAHCSSHFDEFFAASAGEYIEPFSVLQHSSIEGAKSTSITICFFILYSTFVLVQQANMKMPRFSYNFPLCIDTA
jgi:hypothetical protein